jgi:hypothetical protein
MSNPYEGRPAPIVPAEVTMSGDDWFPFYFDRVRKSKWWRRASDLARARNVMLWGEAYKETPAGSLPDDDDDLAEKAGFGFDVDSWLTAKADILAPWLLCDDGRWYHPTVCETVLNRWETTTSKRKAEATRKAVYRQKVRADRRDVPRDTPPGPTGHPHLSRGTPPLVPMGLGQEREKTEKTNSVASASPLATEGEARKEGPSHKEPWKSDPDFCAFWSAATQDQRRRAKSRANLWPEWVKAKKIAPAAVILTGQRLYNAKDPDVKRTGGPGLHIWLAKRTWETWTDESQEAADLSAFTPERWGILVRMWREDGTWDARLGPPPGAPGCRVPAEALIRKAVA